MALMGLIAMEGVTLIEPLLARSSLLEARPLLITPAGSARSSHDLFELAPSLTPDVLRGLLHVAARPYDSVALDQDHLAAAHHLFELLEEAYPLVIVPAAGSRELQSWLPRLDVILFLLPLTFDRARLAQEVEHLIRTGFTRARIGCFFRQRPVKAVVAAFHKEWALPVVGHTEEHPLSLVRIFKKLMEHDLAAHDEEEISSYVRALRSRLKDEGITFEQCSRDRSLMKQQLEPVAYDVISRSRSFPESAGCLDQLVQRVLDATLGLGPLEDLLTDPTITEIMVNGHEQIYVERGGCLERVTTTFTDERELRAVIERIIAPLGRRIDESSPLVDARLPDGSRVNAIIPPLALNGPVLTIRRFDQRMKSMSDLVAAGMLTEEIAEFLATKVRERCNIIISGGTGSGKTTFLNALSGNISPDERIITIEDAAELQLRQAHVVRLETRPANLEGVGAVTIRDLVRNSLRMRPDRIVVGEVRGAEAFDMLQAMNTGHDGSLTTIHANAAADALRRLEVMVLSAHDLPLRVIREQIVSAIDLVIHLARSPNGQRQVVEMVEIDGIVDDAISLRRCP